MSIRYECEECGSVLKIKDDLAGKPGKCPKCKTPFTVPAAAEDSDSSGELASTESVQDAESQRDNSHSTDSSGDFDVDAFLSGDADSDLKVKPKSSKTSRPSNDIDADQSLGETDDQPKSPRSKSRAGNAEEAFQIRRGPDATSKATSTPIPGLDGDVDETPAPTRRPPGTNPNAAASNIASDLLSKSAKKGKKANWDEAASQKSDEPSFDWESLRYEARTKLLPVVAGGVVVCLLGYFLLLPMFGSKAFVPKMGTVTGTITVNGKPLAAAQVFFHPVAAKQESKGKQFKVGSSIGQTDAAGHYELMYDQDHKGAVIGKCRVEIMVADITGISPKYYQNNANAATVEVNAGKQVIDLELSQ